MESVEPTSTLKGAYATSVQNSERSKMYQKGRERKKKKKEKKEKKEEEEDNAS